MRAVGVRTFGNTSPIEAFDVPEREPGQGEVRVKVGFAGVNAIDGVMRSGAYAQSSSFKTDLPLVLGIEGAGTVDKVGAGVTDIRAGDRVAWCLSGGTWAEKAIVPAWRLVKVPDSMPLDVAAAFQVQGMAAHYLSTATFPIQVGDTCLVHAGASGTGQLLVQLCKLQGAKVIATAGSKEKGEIARVRGAEHVILYRETDFQKRVLELTNGEGVNVVFDGVGRDTMARSLHCLRRRGMCVSYGNASGSPGAINMSELGEAHSIFVTRPHLSDYMQTPEEVAERARVVFGLHQQGQLTATVDRVVPLAEAGQALAALAGRQAKGKIVLKVA